MSIPAEQSIPPSTENTQNDMEARIEKAKNATDRLLVQLAELESAEGDEFTERLKKQKNDLTNFSILYATWQESIDKYKEVNADHRGNISDLRRQLQNWKDQPKSFPEAITEIKENEADKMISTLLNCLKELKELLEKCFDSSRSKKELETEETSAKNIVDQQIAPWEEAIKSTQELVADAKVTRYVKGCHFSGRFNLCPLAESVVTGQIEQYHANVTTFEPFSDPEYTDAGLKLDVHCIPFYPFQEQVKTRQCDGSATSWEVCLGETPYIDIRLQRDKIEASWCDTISLENAPAANLLLFSIIRFTIITKNGAREPQYCQLLKPGTLKTVLTGHTPKEKRRVQEFYDLATIDMTGLEFVKNYEGAEKWLNDTLIDNGEFTCEEFHGNANFILDDEVQRPKVLVSAGRNDSESQNLENMKCFVSLIQRDNVYGKLVELILFEQIEKQPKFELHELGQ